MTKTVSRVYDVYISIHALMKSLLHAALNKRNEVLGFLIGDFYVWNGCEYTLIDDTQPVESTSKPDMVEPAENSLASAFNKINKTLEQKMIVGWYHSHPDYGCFLSSIDVQTQRNFFSRSYHVALVIDPIRINCEFFKLTEESYRKVSFVVFKEVKKK